MPTTHRKTGAPGDPGHRITRIAGLVATILLLGVHGFGCNCGGELTGKAEGRTPGQWMPGGSDHADDLVWVADAQPGPKPLDLGDWEAYPELGEDAEWPDEPLNAQRWARVSAELACAGRKNRGDPDSQRQLVRNIIGHHRTTLIAVAEWSTHFNREQPEQARRWAQPISNAVKGCR